MQRIALSILVLILLLGASWFLFHTKATPTACSDRVPPPRILAFGDSLVVGYGATTEGGFVSLLHSYIGIPITNQGVSGDTTEKALARIQDATDLKPDIAFVLLGGNDALQKVPEVTTRAHLASIIEAFQQQGTHVVLLGVIGGFPDPYASMYKELAKTYDTAYVPNVLSGVIGHADLMSDPIHPNEAGYQKIAERVAPVLEKECASLTP